MKMGLEEFQGELTLLFLQFLRSLVFLPWIFLFLALLQTASCDFPRLAFLRPASIPQAKVSQWPKLFIMNLIQACYCIPRANKIAGPQERGSTSPYMKHPLAAGRSLQNLTVHFFYPGASAFLNRQGPRLLHQFTYLAQTAQQLVMKGDPPKATKKRRKRHHPIKAKPGIGMKYHQTRG